MTTLGERIKNLRKKLGLSQRALARMADLRQPSISALENGSSKRMHSDTMFRVAEALGVTTDWLQNGEGDLPRVKKPKVIDERLQTLIENWERFNDRDRDVLLNLAKSLNRTKRGSKKS